MSGGVGPTCSDISLPQEKQEQETETLHKQLSDSSSSRKFPYNKNNSSSSSSSSAYLSFRQLNALAIIIIFSASGMVCPSDLAFVLFSMAYIFFISRLSFPTLHDDPPVFSPHNPLLRLYIYFAAAVGLLLPIAYILDGILQSDKEGIKAASPHVFLLASQVFMEGVAGSNRFSTPIRVFVPVFYNSRRIFTLAEWLRDEFGKEDKEYGGTVRRLFVGRALAVANMVLWCFNLFGFLLPVYLPRALNKYYSVYKPKGS